MSEEIVKIKGSKNGLKLDFVQGADFASIERDIRGKLESGSGFFTRGTVIQVAPNSLKKNDRERLRKLFSQHGVLFRTTDPMQELREREKLREEKEKILEEKRETEVQQMVVVNRTLRGGQEIRTDSSVLICGNVNPGAQIIAGGSIDIRGTCRGMVHAGANGNAKAFIVADRLMPMQIRIANLIARAPDDSAAEKTDQAERASIKDGQIVIEPIDR